MNRMFDDLGGTTRKYHTLYFFTNLHVIKLEPAALEVLQNILRPEIGRVLCRQGTCRCLGNHMESQAKALISS